MPKLTTPVTYQGGKHRLAPEVLDRINPDPGEVFYDLCCGSGAISIALVNRGYPPNKIVLLDKSPWGLFWRLVGQGNFDLSKFESLLKEVPKDATKIKHFVTGLSTQRASTDTVYVFLVLQAASFGGKAVWIKDDRWVHHGFRNYWMPTETSRRRHPVNPMMPMPETLLQRVQVAIEKMQGAVGMYQDIRDFTPGSGTAYVDPPYGQSTSYGHNFDVAAYVQSLSIRCYVSEARPLAEKSYLIFRPRTKGGISGKRRSPNEEWLSEFN